MKLRLATVAGIDPPRACDVSPAWCAPECPHLQHDGSLFRRCRLYAHGLVQARNSVLHERCAPCVQGTEVEA